jgi:alanyl aminopeptidase
MLGASSQKFTVRKLCGVALMPNASATGYYRFSMPSSDWSRLATSFKSLNAAEQLATLHSMRAAFRAGSTDANTYVAALRNGVTLGEWDVIELATGFLEEIHDDLLDASQRPVFEQNMRAWFAKPLAGLSAGSSAAAGTSAALSKAALASLGVTLVRHPPALASFSARGAEILKTVAQAKNNPTLDELAPASLWAFMSTGGTDAADAAIAALKATREAETRNAIVRAMAAARDPAALARVQSHVLSGELRVRELILLSAHGFRQRRQPRRVMALAEEELWQLVVAHGRERGISPCSVAVEPLLSRSRDPDPQVLRTASGAHCRRATHARQHA